LLEIRIDIAPLYQRSDVDAVLFLGPLREE
jgi:hypothetical protein